MLPYGVPSMYSGLMSGAGIFTPGVDRQVFIPAVCAQSNPPATAGIPLYGVWSKPRGAQIVRVQMVGPGGGGGSGRKGSNASISCAGGGGASGGYVDWTFSAADLPNEVPLYVPCGATGGAAQTTNSTNGNAGQTFSVLVNSALFGAWPGASNPNNIPILGAACGGSGAGGTASTGTAGSANAGFWGMWLSVAGAAASTTGTGGSAGTNGNGGIGPSSGGSGGGLTAGNLTSTGGNGGGIIGQFDGQGNGGVAATAGTNGMNSLILNQTGNWSATPHATFQQIPPGMLMPGSGGGGGGSSNSASAGGNGGNGLWGGGGGSGGAATDTTSTQSGNGGNGGDAFIIVMSW